MPDEQKTHSELVAEVRKGLDFVSPSGIRAKAKALNALASLEEQYALMENTLAIDIEEIERYKRLVAELEEQFESMNRELTATASQLRREGYSALADRIEALTTRED